MVDDVEACDGGGDNDGAAAGGGGVLGFPSGNRDGA
jgi:hypothetical protein